MPRREIARGPAAAFENGRLKITRGPAGWATFVAGPSLPRHGVDLSGQTFFFRTLETLNRTVFLALIQIDSPV